MMDQKMFSKKHELFNFYNLYIMYKYDNLKFFFDDLNFEEFEQMRLIPTNYKADFDFRSQTSN